MDASLAGKWTGKYDCGPISGNPFTLTLAPGEGGTIEGEFRFDVPGRTGETGAYRVVGRVAAASGEFTLAPVKWIERPQGIVAFGLAGKLGGGGRSITGSLPGCVAFGHPSFSAERADMTAATQALRDAGPPARPTGGPLEGTWTGTISCPFPRRPDDVFPLTMTVVQDGGGIAALVTITDPNPRRGAPVPQQTLFVAPSRGPTQPASLGQPLSVGGRIAAVAPKSLSLDPSAGTISVQLLRPGCATNARRTGPAQLPGLPQGGTLVGTWAGVDYGVLARQLAQMTELARSGGGRRGNETQLVLLRDGGTFYGEFRASYPPDKPTAQQDRFAVSVRPLFALEDGRIALVPLAVRRADSAFDAAGRMPGGGPLAYAGPFVLLAHHPEGDTLLLDRANRSLAGEQPEIAMRRENPAQAVATAAGEGAPVAMPPGIGGTLASAASLKAQCGVLADWARPFTSRPKVMDTPLGPLLTREALPMFDDQAFVPVFGLSFATTTEAQRRPIWTMLQRTCPERFDMALLRHDTLTRPWLTGFAETNASLMDRQDAKSVAASVTAEVPSLGDDRAGLTQLGQIESQSKERIEELSEPERAAVHAVIAAKRDRIVVAMLRARVREIAQLPDNPDTLGVLATLLKDVRASPMAPDEQASVRLQAHDKGRRSSPRSSSAPTRARPRRPRLSRVSAS